MLLYILRALQILFQSIIQKPLKMLTVKLYLLCWMGPRRVAHPIMGGGGGWTYPYQQKVNKWLIDKVSHLNKYFYSRWFAL